jgi:hypothetical protein
MRLRNRVTAFALLSMALPSLVIPADAQQKPNVVFILADNVGYGDLGPYGGGELRGAPTPRIDQLANEGLRLTQYLVEPIKWRRVLAGLAKQRYPVTSA